MKGGDIYMLTFTNLSPMAALLFGVLILIFPRFLNYFVAAYLILSGILGLGLIQ